MAAPERIYARALFDASREKDRLQAVREEIADLVAALDDVPELAAVLTNRETESRVKADVLTRILSGGDELVLNFARLLAEKGRAGEIRGVAAEFEALATAEERILNVELTTAHELSDTDFEGILADIEQKSGRKVRATRSVAPELIGGIVLQAGSLRLDASVRGRLDRLRTDLAAAR